ncbi:MAG TPA: hypothetical protein VKE69_14740, partial [Planctomycetota bacterium]|nr:hypothetical protein [Planctomycetota bacterium]
PGARPAPASDGRAVVLFLGDSNMYGLHVAPESTLPAQAEALSRASAAPGFRAVNRGRVGQPSWFTLDEARDAIAKHRPAAVVVRVGVNNRVLATPEGAGWYESLRVVRLARIGIRNWTDARLGLTHAASRPRSLTELGADGRFVLRHPVRDGDEAPPIEVVHDLSAAEDYDAKVRPRLRRDLVAIAAEASRAGAKTVFASYFDDAEALADADADLAWAARESGSAFVDLAEAGRRARAIRDRDELTFPDHHATALGYLVEAHEVVRALQKIGVGGGTPPPDPVQVLAHLPSRAESRIDVALADPESLTFAIHAPANRAGRLLVGGAGTLQLGGWLEVPVAEDAASWRCRASSELAFRTDERGVARVTLPAAIRERVAERAHAAAVIYRGAVEDEDALEARVSAAVVFDVLRR